MSRKDGSDSEPVKKSFRSSSSMNSSKKRTITRGVVTKLSKLTGGRLALAGGHHAEIYKIQTDIKTLIQSLNAQSLTDKSTAKQLFEYGFLIQTTDSSSYLVKNLQSASEYLLNLEQVNSSAVRNIQTKVLDRMNHDVLDFATDAGQFMSVIVEFLQIYTSLYRVAYRNTSHTDVSRMMEMRSISTSTSVPLEYFRTSERGTTVRIPYAEMVKSGKIQMKSKSSEKRTTYWAVLKWQELLLFPSVDNPVVSKSVALVNCLVQRTEDQPKDFEIIAGRKTIRFTCDDKLDRDDWQFNVESCVCMMPADHLSVSDLSHYEFLELVDVAQSSSTAYCPPKSVANFLETGETTKHWRDLYEGNSYMIQWLTRSDHLQQLLDCFLMKTKLKSSSSSRKSKKSSRGNSALASAQSRQVRSERAYTALVIRMEIFTQFFEQGELLRYLFVEFLGGSHLDQFVLELFCKIFEKLLQEAAMKLYCFLINNPEISEMLLNHIENEHVLKRLIAIWNYQQKSAAQVQLLNQLCNQALSKILDTKEPEFFDSEGFYHCLIFLHVFVRRHYTLCMHKGYPLYDLPPINMERRPSSKNLSVEMETFSEATEIQPKKSKRGKPSLIDSLDVANSRSRDSTPPRKKKKKRDNASTMNLLDGPAARIPVASGKTLDNPPPSRRPRIMTSASAPHAAHAESTPRRKSTTFFVHLNTPEIASSVLECVLHGRPESPQIQVKMLDFLTCSIRFLMKDFDSTKELPALVTSLLEPANLSHIRALLDCSSNRRSLGFLRLGLVRLVRWLIHMENESIWKALWSHDVVQACVELFFVFPSNGFLPFDIEELFQCLAGLKSAFLLEGLIESYGLLEKLLPIARDHDKYPSAYPFVVKICRLLRKASLIVAKLEPRASWNELLQLVDTGLNDVKSPRFKEGNDFRATATQQLENHWEDFYYLFSAF